MRENPPAPENPRSTAPNGQASPRWIDLLPHQPPMRLVEDVLDVTPGERARCARVTKPDDWFFQGHFPAEPVVPAIVLIELLAQTGGLAAGSRADADGRPLAMRVAAVGAFKFPAGAGSGVTLEADARVAGRMGALYKIEGTVTADGRLVATGSVTLAEVRPDATRESSATSETEPAADR